MTLGAVSHNDPEDRNGLPVLRRSRPPPVRERSNRAGRVLAGILREYAGAGDEHVRDVPNL